MLIDNIEAIQPRETRQIELSNDKLEMLLFDLLQELIFLKDAERLLLRLREVVHSDPGWERLRITATRVAKAHIINMG